MNANRMVGALVTGLALCFVGYSGPKVAAQVGKFATRSDYPITIVSMAGKPNGETDRTGKPELEFNVKLKNATDQPVVSYTLSFSWQDASGALVGGGSFAKWDSGGDWTEPLIPAGGTTTTQVTLMQRSSTLKATVDFALLADGTFYGPDRSRSLDSLQKHLVAARAMEEYVLSLLNTQGPDAVKQFLTSELAKGAQDRKVLRLKLAGFTDASFSYTP
ncbi:MAG TPA: hypothetical protein VKO18_02960 [Terriglobia bacterium]|nr:hypothetical protein [Terriglobia bacterium]